MKNIFSKITLLLILSLIMSESLIAQEYIPYRKGKLWGISDEKAKIIIKPQYDSVVIKSIEPTCFFETFKNKKKGYIINNKEIIPAKYDAIKSVGGNLFFASNRTEENLYVQDFYTSDGKKLLKSPAYFVEQYDLSNFSYFSGEQTDHRELIKFTDEKQKESVFIWNSNQQKIEIWLLKNVHSIVLNPKHSPNGKILMHYKKSDNSLLEDVYYTVENNKIVKAEKTAKQLKVDYDYLERGYESVSEGYSSYGTGTGSGTERMLGDPVVEYSHRGESGGTSQKMVYKTVTLFPKDGKIFTGNYAGTNLSEGVTYSFQPEKIETKSSVIKFIENDTEYHYTNYVIYKLNRKNGFFYKEPYERSTEYDTLIWKPGISSRNYSVSKPYIIVGNKKDNVFRYGIVDIDHQIVLPIEYQEINPSGISARFWITKKNDKYQILPRREEDSQWISKEYDLIELKERERFLLVKRGNKYGVVFRGNDSKDKFSESESFFDYRIRRIYRKFYKEENESKSRITRLELEDENGKFLGYAHPNGTLYFED